MDYIRPEALVETQWLEDRLGTPDIAIIDASFHLPDTNRDPMAEFFECHIPGAVFFNIDTISDQNTDLPHMLPDGEKFSTSVGSLGISSEHHVICYDANGGPMAAMRVFWTFKIFGHDKVSLLNGGLLQWLADGRLVTSGEAKTSTCFYNRGEYHQEWVEDIHAVIRNVDTTSAQFVDARSPGRFSGIEPEPRDGLRRGHVPGSLNLPFQNLLQIDNHMRLKPANDLCAVIENAGIDPNVPVISSCGSGVTAAVLYFAFYLLGHNTLAIYDGSWAEWASRPDTPIEADIDDSVE